MITIISIIDLSYKSEVMWVNVGAGVIQFTDYYLFIVSFNYMIVKTYQCNMIACLAIGESFNHELRFTLNKAYL